MALEVVRERINGIWRTVVKPEPSGGGGLPDPSGEPDGDVLTVDSGAAVWAPGGGSQPHTRETFVDTTTISAGAFEPLAWTHDTGDALFDLSDPLNPVVLATGTYAFTLNVRYSGANQTGTGISSAVLALDTADANYSTESAIVIAGQAQSAGTPETIVPATYYLEEGMTVNLSVLNGDADNERAFLLNGLVQRIG